MISVYVYTPNMNPMQTLYFEDAQIAEAFVQGVQKNGYQVEVFVDNVMVSDSGE